MPETVKFVTERFRLLAYLGHGQGWWSDPGNACHAALLATLVPMLGDYALTGPSVRRVTILIYILI